LSTDPNSDDRETWPTLHRPAPHRPTAPRALPPEPETAVQTPPPPLADVPPDRGLGWGMLLALVVVALVVAGVVIAWLLTHRGGSNGTSTVVLTQPGGRKVRPGTPMLVAVPAVVGEQQEAAEQSLRAAGFDVRAVTIPSDAPKGAVVAQHPAASQNARHGSAVRINVSAGSTARTTTAPATTAAATTTAQPATAAVPDVTNGELQSAVQQLATAGFRISLQYVPSTDPLGTVVAQSPQSGASAPTASHVTVNAASGPGDKPQETVPDLTGGSLPHAVSTANGAHLRLIYVKRTVTDHAQAGVVVDQSPAAGGHAPRNAQVLAYLGAYKGP
jgi:beta-lactam-binding protein with PASTA domain